MARRIVGPFRCGRLTALGAPTTGANCQLLQWTDGRIQVAMREMQLDDGVFQVRMAAKQLNGSQIGPGFQVVRGKTVAQRARTGPFRDAGTNGGLFADIPNGLIGDGLFRATMAGAARKEKILRSSRAPIRA